MDRLRPLEAERAVLGAIINKNELFQRLGVTEDDFFSPVHRRIYTAMVDLVEAGTAIDEVTLSNALISRPSWNLEKSQLEEVGGLAYVAQLGLCVPTVDNAHHYAGIVCEAAHLRRLQHIVETFDSRIAGGANAADLYALFAKETTPLGKGEPSPTLADVKPRPVAGLPTGLGIERFVPGGLPRDKVTVIYGETGSFKTTIKNHVLFSLARAGHRCLDVSLEDSSDLTLARYLAQRHSVPYGELAAQTVEAPPLDEDDKEILGRIVDGSTIRPSIDRVVAAARNEGVSAVFIDYIQLLEGCSSDHTELAEAMRKAQLAAKEDGIAYVFLSQVKQDVNYRATQRDGQGRIVGDPRPRINDTLGSSAIRTHAKLGLGVFRPWAYCPVPTNPNGPYGDYCEWVNNYPGGVEAAMALYPGLLEIIIGKNVMGPAQQTVHVMVDPATGKVRPYAL